MGSSEWMCVAAAVSGGTVYVCKECDFASTTMDAECPCCGAQMSNGVTELSEDIE